MDDENLLDAVLYAINSGNVEMFDMLSKDFEKLDQEDRDSILVKTVTNASDPDFIQHVLDYGFDLNYKDEQENTLLHYAAVSSYPSTVKFFLKKGLNIEAKNKSDATPLVLAAKETDNVDVLKALIDAGADKSVTAYGGENLLITAAGCNPNPEIVRYLLKLGFDPEERDGDGFTALLNAAAYQENVDVFEELTKVGANINAKTKHGDNMFHLVAYNASGSIARFVSPSFHSSDLNNDGETCIEKALFMGRSPAVLRVFLQKQREEQIMLACLNENPAILETLIFEGYNPNVVDSSGTTAMMMAAKVNPNPEVIAMLKYYKAVWNSRDDSKRNALHYAAMNKTRAVYEYMMSDSDFSTLAGEKDDKGNTPDYYLENPDDF